MRIALLEKRENFEKILRETLSTSSLLKENHHGGEISYCINKYLNFISTNKLPENVFQILVNEYSSSLSWWKKVIQALYVKLAVSKMFRTFFSHNKIKLSSNYENLLILGGNHRLRLFSIKLESSFVLLKKGERDNYIKNDIAIRKENNINYAPQVLNYGEDWLEEEYFEGVPINRLEDQSKIKELKYTIFNAHFKALNHTNIKSHDKIDYINIVRKEVTQIVSNKKIITKGELIEKIQGVFELLFSKLTEYKIKVSWSHGDFQEANILVANNVCNVIDWESSDKRFYLYDAFILFGRLREGKSLAESLENFKESMASFYLIEDVDDNVITLLLIEELRFNVNETFSSNFFESGAHSESLCDAIMEFING